jgi:hypothetical protein
MLDTTAFDAKIADLNNQLATVQSTYNTDPLAMQLAALQVKSDAVSSLQNQIQTLQNNKAQAITVQAQIDSTTAQLNSQTTQLTTLQATAK